MGVDQAAGSGAEGRLPWSLAWEAAAYGPGGFYRDGPGAREWPARFFRTSVHVGAVFHAAIAALLLDVDGRLGHPEQLDLVDVGAGRGELLPGVLDALPGDVAARVRAVAIDVHEPPPDLDPRVTWLVGAAPATVPRGLRGLLVANEWLDDVPLDVVVVDGNGLAHLVLVGRDGTEQLGPSFDDDNAWAAWGLDVSAARDWLNRDRLAPDSRPYRPGDRVELGWTRDAAWGSVLERLDNGTAVAIDYPLAGGVRAGTLTGYDVGGRAVAPVPDGRTNLTAHVRTDTVAAAVGGVVMRQRDALQALGVSGRVPDVALASRDPWAYADALERASAASELLDVTGLGAFHWVRVDR